MGSFPKQVRRHWQVPVQAVSVRVQNELQNVVENVLVKLYGDFDGLFFSLA
jgi:hypothetical protein